MRGVLSGLLAFMATLPGFALAETAFAPGQVWSLSGAYPTSRVLIGKLETLDGDPVVHVTVFDVPVSDAPGNMRIASTIGHMPYTEAAMRRSVKQLLEEGHAPFENFEGGYQQWKAANGGVFTVTVAEGINVALKVAYDGKAAD